MRLLLIGNRNHQFIYNYVKHLKSHNTSVTVDILSYDTVKCKYQFDYLYDNILYPKLPLFLTKNKYINYIFRSFALVFKILSLSDYDYIHIHYVEKPLQNILPIFLFKVNGKIITSVWGSDFYKRSNTDRYRIKSLFINSHKITFTSKRFADDFINFYNDSNITSKICFFKLGLEPLEYLDEVFRNDEHINIMIGYNARHNQCHLKILNSISECQILDKQVQLLVPLTYPKDDEKYRSEIKESLKKTKLNHIVYEDFLTDRDVAQLRINTDVFVQLQKTDVLSGAMLEHIAAGSIIITGDWLPYDDLKDMGVELIKISSHSAAGPQIVEVLNNMQYYKVIAKKNAAIIKNNYKWDNLISDCIKVYD